MRYVFAVARMGFEESVQRALASIPLDHDDRRMLADHRVDIVRIMEEHETRAAWDGYAAASSPETCEDRPEDQPEVRPEDRPEDPLTPQKNIAEALDMMIHDVICSFFPTKCTPCTPCPRTLVQRRSGRNGRRAGEFAQKQKQQQQQQQQKKKMKKKKKYFTRGRRQ